MNMDAHTAFRLLADGLSRQTDRDFFPWLASRLASIVGADMLVIGSVLPMSRRIRTLVLCIDGNIVDNVEYSLAGSPCERLFEEDVCFYARNVAAIFPRDSLLTDLDAQAYLGVRMMTPDNRLIGLMAAIYRRPLIDSGLAEEVLSIAAARAGAELASQQAERALANTERELAATHDQLARTNRALTLLRLVNRAVIRSTDEMALLDEACRLAVDEGGYRLAWAGVANQEDQRIIPLAYAGVGAEFLDSCHFSWSEHVPEGLAPSGLSIREKSAQVLPSLATSPAYAPFAAEALRHGMVTEIALPLGLENQRSVLVLLSGRSSEVISDDELTLLQELADNLSWGVSALRIRRKQELMQQAVLDLAEAVTARSDESFFDHLAQRLARALSADVALVARIDPSEPLKASLLAGVVDDRRIDRFSFDFAGLPCEAGLHDAERVIDRGLDVDFPQVARLLGDGFQAWVDRCLEDTNGDVIGVVILLFRQPLGMTDCIRHILRIFAAGAAAEVERHRSDAHIRHLAYFDPGTGLSNRVHFMERLNAAILHARNTRSRLALMFLDLNRFKEINDSQGHDVGDQVLQEVASRFDDCLTDGESLARLGGDEFVVMVRSADKARATEVVQRLLATLAAPVMTDGHSFSIDVSIGVAFYPEDGDGPRELLKNTDIAMYHAKESGSGYCFYVSSMGQDLRRRLLVASRLRIALENQQLALHFQPIVDLNSRELVGVEVLCRWLDDELGPVDPYEFIAVAEERGLIVQLGEWVLDATCRQIAKWEKAQLTGLPERVYINLAAVQLEEPELASTLGNIAEAAGISPRCIGLELTESSLMRDPERAVRTMAQMFARGFVLSIDDFGTGYSSLSYLKRFAAQSVKIDMSFVSDMLIDNNDHSIIATIIAMADRLGLTTVAEGVETTAQADALKSMGCRMAQGYLFSPPLTAEEFERLWLAEPRPKALIRALDGGAIAGRD